MNSANAQSLPSDNKNMFNPFMGHFLPSTSGGKVHNILVDEQPQSHPVDYVVVYKAVLPLESVTKIETFVFNLENKGFHVESVKSEVNDKINFLKIYAPQNVVFRFAKLFGVELACHNLDYKVRPKRPYDFMATELTKPNPQGALFWRAKDTFLGTTPTTVTNAEKSLIIYKVLARNPYGINKHDYGVDKLIRQKVFVTAYPLHDGPYQWTDEGPLNDRQLLSKFWSNMSCWYKQQPLDVIERYFGPESSFYFAWLGFYNKMLIPASIIGFLSFLLGALCFDSTTTRKDEEVCDSNIFLCPRCLESHCKYEPLSSVCLHTQLMFLLGNPMVITFAALMSVWSTLFLELWRREEAMLQIRWNLRSVEADCSMRYTITSSVIILMVSLVVLGILAVMVYVKSISVVLSRSQDEVKVPVGLLASLTGSLMSVGYIVIFELFYQNVAKWLTEMENPRTQIEFDNSYTYKAYALAFVINYSVIFYIAFLKARFYTYPGDDPIFTVLGGIGSDLCDPAGCMIELTIQIVVTLCGKKVFLTIKQYFFPRIMVFLNKMMQEKRQGKKIDSKPEWETDYYLNPLSKNHFMEEFMQMVIQYGFVTFFVAAFPPAPLLALVNNIFELRVDAQKLTRAYRRPVSFKVPNLGAWNGILRGITYIGVATNVTAFVIAFTSDFVQSSIYRQTVEADFAGYIDSLLSVYNISEYSVVHKGGKNISVCYYPGKRHPPDHPYRYQVTADYFFHLTIKFVVVVIFEHTVMLVTGLIAYLIPSIPFSVKEYINHHRNQLKAEKLKDMRGTFLKEEEGKKMDIYSEV